MLRLAWVVLVHNLFKNERTETWCLMLTSSKTALRQTIGWNKFWWSTLIFLSYVIILLYVLFWFLVDIFFYYFTALPIIRTVLKKQACNIYKYWSYNRNLRLRLSILCNSQHIEENIAIELSRGHLSTHLPMWLPIWHPTFFFAKNLRFFTACIKDMCIQTSTFRWK